MRRRRGKGSLGRGDLLLSGPDPLRRRCPRAPESLPSAFARGRQPALDREAARCRSVPAARRPPRREGGGQLGRRRVDPHGQARPGARLPAWSPPASGRSRRGGRWRRPAPRRTRRCPTCRRRRAASAIGKPLSRSAASTRSAPRCATPSRTARTISGRPDPPGEPDQRSPGAEVPHRGAQAEERRHEPHVARRGAPGRHVLRLLRGGDDPEVVAEPLDHGAGREHHRFGAPGRLAARRGQATMGKVPAPPRSTPRRADRRGRCTGRACRPCRRSPWPGPAGCSPGRRARPAGRRPCRRWAAPRGAPRRLPMRPGGVDDGRQHGATGSAASGAVPRPTRVARSTRSVTAGVGGVGDVQRVGRRARATRERPGHPSCRRCRSTARPRSARARSGSTVVQDGHHLGRRRVGRQADPVGLQHQAGADGAQILPADAGRDGRARWRAPTRCSRRAGWRCPRRPPGPPSRAPPAPTARTASAMRAASNSTRPGAGESGRSGTRCSWSTVASGRTMAARTPEVPTSTTRMLPPGSLMATAPGRRARRGRTCPG